MRITDSVEEDIFLFLMATLTQDHCATKRKYKLRHGRYGKGFKLPFN